MFHDVAGVVDSSNSLFAFDVASGYANTYYDLNALIKITGHLDG